MSRFEPDPTVWKSKFYPLIIDCEAKADGVGAGSIPLDNTDFILKRVTHVIIGDTDSAAATDVQDGQYLVQVRDQSTGYMSGYCQADALLGTPRTGFFMDWPAPTLFTGKSVIKVDMINVWDRTLAGVRQFFRVQWILHGLERWDEVCGAAVDE